MATQLPNSMQSSAPISVKDFGAVGDGVTDDTAAIQAAIDTGAKEIHRPDGRYAVTSISYGFDVTFTGPGIIVPSSEVQTDEYGTLTRAGTKIGNTFPLDKHGGFVVGGEGPSEHGVMLKAQRQASTDLIPSRIFNPLEAQLYPHKITGFCTTDGATATLTYSSGFDGDLDNGFFVGDTIWVGADTFTINAKPTPSTLTLDSVPADYSGGISCFVLYETSDSVVDISGTTVTLVSGEKFQTYGSDHNMIIDGVRVGFTPSTETSGTLASAPGNATGKSIEYRFLSGEEYVEIMRWQRVHGAGIEETFSIAARPDMYLFRSGAGSGGRQSPVVFQGPAPADEPFPNNDDPQTWIAMDSTGKLGIHKRTPEAELHIARNYDSTQGDDDTQNPLLRLEHKWNGVAGSRRAVDFDARNDFTSTRIQGRSGADLTGFGSLEVQPEGGNLLLGSAGASMSFYGAGPVAQPSVTGSRGGNAALASLLTALDALGLITDNTTA